MSREIAATPIPPLLEIRGLVKEYRLPRIGLTGRSPRLRAVAGIDLEVARAETYGLVGESGSGKSTVARLVLGLVPPTAGSIRILGQERGRGDARDRALRRHAQMVFQDPFSSFDPLARLADSIGEPLRTHARMPARERRARVAELLRLVGLDPAYAARYPAQLSGGQLQRAAVARALAPEPQLVVLDEPVSALDVSTQAQVINLLEDLQESLQVGYLLIAHDLSVVEHVAHRVGVMYLGRIVETGPTDAVYRRPAHPYTEALVSAVPLPDPRVQRAREVIRLRGEVPSAARAPSGCRFRTRCPFTMDVCATEDPPPYRVADTGVTVHCHLHEHGPRLAGASVRELRGLGRGPG